MKYITKLVEELRKEKNLHEHELFNYAIPRSWNLFGYQNIKTLRSNEVLVNPYDFFTFSLSQLIKDKDSIKMIDETSQVWLKKASVYAMMIRTASAWDHDRDGRLPHENLYHLPDNGTFLKSILLLPLYKRMGVNTILLQQPFAICKTSLAHDYAPKEAVVNFQKLDDHLHDTLVPTMEVVEQCKAFVEACHMLDMRIIIEYCPAHIARKNDYMQQHPEWFYWIKKDEQTNYHPPICDALPQNTIPYGYALKDFYHSEDVRTHISKFTNFDTIDTCVIAPSFSDQINTNGTSYTDFSTFRFYKDFHEDTPSQFVDRDIPYLLQDTLRSDLHPCKQPIFDLWEMLNQNIIWYLETFDIDGIYLAKPYQLPQDLQQQFAHTLKTTKKTAAIIAEEAVIEQSASWIEKGYDAISGNSGYVESQIWDFKFHSFAYRLKDNICPMFAGSEFADTKRISSCDGKDILTTMLCVMNQFLPNGIPFLLNGIEAYEVQPLQLSEYSDRNYLYSLTKDDPRYYRQGYLDEFYFRYTAENLHLLPTILQKTSQIRQAYLSAIVDIKNCVPVWFDSPRDYGIGYTYINDHSALLVVCNTNVHDQVHLHIHTENLICELPFKIDTQLQIFSTVDPFIHDVVQDSFHNFPLTFAPGEVKFIELRSFLE